MLPYMFPCFPYLSYSRLKVVLSARNWNFGGQIQRIHDSHIEHYFKGDLKTLASRVMLAMAKEKVKIITETTPMQSTTSNQNGSECWVWLSHRSTKGQVTKQQKTKQDASIKRFSTFWIAETIKNDEAGEEPASGRGSTIPGNEDTWWTLGTSKQSETSHLNWNPLLPASDFCYAFLVCFFCCCCCMCCFAYFMLILVVCCCSATFEVWPCKRM